MYLCIFVIAMDALFLVCVTALEGARSEYERPVPPLLPPPPPCTASTSHLQHGEEEKVTIYAGTRACFTLSNSDEHFAFILFCFLPKWT